MNTKNIKRILIAVLAGVAFWMAREQYGQLGLTAKPVLIGGFGVLLAYVTAQASVDQQPAQRRGAKPTLKDRAGR